MWYIIIALIDLMSKMDHGRCLQGGPLQSALKFPALQGLGYCGSDAVRGYDHCHSHRPA